jgi:alpha-beta hydrolase superfamily lysophospholipase
MRILLKFVTCFYKQYALDYSQKTPTITWKKMFFEVSMKHTDYVQDISGNGPIYIQSWLPSEKPTAIMIVFHGFGEHSSRYGTHFAEFYTSSKIGIFSVDLPGHGKSHGKKGHIANPSELLEIIDLLIKKLKIEYPKTPLFLYGHSFGGEVTLWYTLVRNPIVNGVIVTSPLIGPRIPFHP